MRVLVTGAAGFVGQHLVPCLATAGHQVLALEPGIDVAHAAALRGAVAKAAPDAIVHLAARSSVADSLREPLAHWRTNLLGACALIDAVRHETPRARVLLVGSSQAYGTAPAGAAPFDEGAPLAPRSPYDLTKACADLLGAQAAAEGLAIVRPRPFNHTGPGQSDAFVASSFARQIAEIEAGQRPPRLEVGNLDSMRDFLHVDDVCDAYLRLLDPAVPVAAYNIASGVGTTARSLLERLLAASHVRPAIEIDPSRVRATDVSIGDATRLRRATGWSPLRGLDSALHALLDQWRARIAHAS